MCASERRARVESATKVAEVMENFMESVVVCMENDMCDASSSLLDEEKVSARCFLYLAKDECSVGNECVLDSTEAGSVVDEAGLVANETDLVAVKERVHDPNVYMPWTKSDYLA